MNNRDRAIRRARSYSKRHNCIINVEHVVKGRGKGIYECSWSGGCPLLWWKDSVVEIEAIYNNGKKVK